MTPSWLTIAALVGASVPEAAAPYETAALAMLDGPQGCWEVVGRASYAWEGPRRSSQRGDAIFVGKLEDGVWTDMLIRSLGERSRLRLEPETRLYPHDIPRFLPVFGARDTVSLVGEHQIAEEALAAVVARLREAVDYAWTDWDDTRDGVVLHRAIPFGDTPSAPEAQMDVFFPRGELAGARADVAFPDGFKLPETRFTVVRDASASLRARVVDGIVFPEAETLSFQVSVVGFTGSVRQSVAYETFRPCGGDVEAAAKPVIGAP